jgi:hypothetical protein
LLAPGPGGIIPSPFDSACENQGIRDLETPENRRTRPMALKPQSMSANESTDVREVQTARLRRDKASENTVIVSATKAIRATGLEDGGSFRFDPSSVEEIGMLAAIGSEETVDGRSARYARNIRHEGQDGGTLRLVIPHEALAELLDPESIDWEDPPEVNVWAGDRLLAFELADPEERTVAIDREAGGDSEDES